MSDWEFLHDMHNDGYSPEQIAEAAACGYNPWEWQPELDVQFFEGSQGASPELEFILESLVESARSYHALTGRYLQIWGELGELYAEIKYGIKRHKPHASGSDGKMGNDYVEVKTVSPEKSGQIVHVKRAGNFNKLLVVKISEDFEFEARLAQRKNLPKGDGGTHMRVSWSSLPISDL